MRSPCFDRLEALRGWYARSVGGGLSARSMTLAEMCSRLLNLEIIDTGMEMATNKKKLLITQSMSKVGWDLFAERGDIEAVQFPNTITSADFRALLEQHAPVNGVALGVTPFGEPRSPPRARCWWWRASASATTPSTCRR